MNIWGGGTLRGYCHYPEGTGSPDHSGECGLEGYACRDPKSDKCSPSLARIYEEFCDKEKEMEEGTSNIEFDIKPDIL